MKYSSNIQIFALSLIMLAGCAKEEIADSPASGGEQISFHIGIAGQETDGGTSTRVATDVDFNSTWEAGDEVGIFAVTDLSKVAEGDYFLRNAKLTYNGTSWVPETPLWWGNSGQLYFYVYHPYKAGANDPTDIAFSVQTDQNAVADGKSNYNASELLTTNGFQPFVYGADVELFLRHALAMVQVVINNSSRLMNTETIPTVRLKNVQTAVDMQVVQQSSGWITVEATGKGEAGDVVMHLVDQPSNAAGMSLTYRALVPPQAIAKDTRMFTIADKDNNFQSTPFTEELELLAGRAEGFEQVIPAGITFTDGSSIPNTTKVGADGILTIKLNGTGSKVIYSVSLNEYPGRDYYIGRKDNETIVLKLNPATGNVVFRSADAGGNAPIGSYAELSLIGYTRESLRGKYKQEADLDLLGDAALTDKGLIRQNWVPIGIGESLSDQFQGSYDGGGYTLSNLYVNRSGVAGLFGRLTNEGSVAHVGIVSGSITGTAYVGGILGTGSGAITACYNSASVTGQANVGGVCGRIFMNKIIACYNTGAVTGEYNIGGVCGNIDYTGVLIACYNTGVVAGSGSSTGGVCGLNTHEIANSYFLQHNSQPGIGVDDNNQGANVAAFGADRWPGNTGDWSTRPGKSDGYWKSLGGWNNGSPTYPKLWWEK